MLKRLILPFLFILFAQPSFAGREAQVDPAFESMRNRFDEILERAGTPISFDEEGKIQLEFDGEFRYRLEYRDDFNFNNATFEDDAVNLLRTRLGMGLKLCPSFQVYAQGQDAESFADRQAHKSNAFVNRWDLRQLYAEFQSPRETIPLSAKVGRQELSYGDQRFVGAFGWSNVARVFDAAKVIYTPVDWFQADAWFSQVLKVNRSQADSGQHDDNFYGLYMVLKSFRDHVLDTFLFLRHNRNNEIAGEKPGELGQLKEYTVGNRFKGEKWNFDYGIEWAVQFGSRAHDDIEAWAWHNEMGYTFDVLLWDPRIHFEYNHGSGDSDPRDGTFESFDNLFPTNHIHYGYIDFASLRNMRNIKIGVGVKPHEEVKFSVDYHWFFLDTNGSPWFHAGQAVIRPKTAGASTTLGQELDLLMTWNLTKHLSFLIGYSYFHAGAFVRDSGTTDDANFFYAQTAVRI
ncbi:MAG: alginate export family protein [Desulfobacterales bacterium]|nr:alginate export family protein [Desulfobacterales bacterium]